MEVNPLDELEALRAEVQDLLQAELARGVAMAPRPSASDLEAAPAAGVARGDAAPPPGRPAPQARAPRPPAPKREVQAKVTSPAPTAPRRRGKTKWGGSPSSPKRPDPPPIPTPGPPLGAVGDSPPPPEVPDWLVEEEEMGPPPDLGVPLPPPPKTFKRPKKRAIPYTFDHVVGSWGLDRRALPPLPAGSPARAAADTLLATRKELGECERCGLCERSSHIVFGMGDPGADLVIVSGAPVQEEEKRGLPIQGDPGKMLDRMLQAVLGLERAKVYILNIVKCRPPRNRAPQAEELARCKPFVDAQLQAIRPKVILVLGTPAAQALLGSKLDILKLRGEWHAWQGVPVRAMVHPERLIKRPEEKRAAMEDLLALKARYAELGGRS